MKRDSTLETAIGFTFATYFGLIVGVSFLATMAKFQSKLSDLPHLVEIGSITFHWLHAAELVLAALLLALTLATGSQRWRAGVSAVLIGFWLVQGLWLLPVLDARVNDLLAGRPSASGTEHFVYAGIEGVKAILLLAAGWLSIRGSA